MMDSSQSFGGAEECQSSESGWTMYIGSPIQDDDQYGSDYADNDDGGTNDGDNDDNSDADHHNDETDSDDSMASDASSGPSHLGRTNGNAVFKDEEEENDGKYCFIDKKAKKPSMQRSAERRKEEKEEMVFMGRKAKAPVQNDAKKVLKTIWMGKRK